MSCPLEELTEADAVYGSSFIPTNLDISTPEHATDVEYWYRHRTEIKNIFLLPRRPTRSRPAPHARGV